MTLTIRPEHQSYECLPVAICVMDKSHMVYANPAFAELHGLSRESFVGLSGEEIIRMLISPDDASWLNAEFSRIRDGHEPMHELWTTLVHRRKGLRTFAFARAGKGPGADEMTYVVIAADADAALMRLTDALSTVALDLLRCRDEKEALGKAMDVLFEHGITSTVLVPCPEGYRIFMIRQDPRGVAFAEQSYGKKIDEITFSREKMKHIPELFRTGKARFIQDFREFSSKMHPEPFASFILEHLPPARSVEAPIFVGDEPFGALSANSVVLTPLMSATIELFARQVGAAMENARHHRLANERLKQLQALQGELVSRERLAALGEAAAVLAHEVRNPLAAILNGLTMLKRDATVAAASHGVLRLVEEEAHHLEHVVHDLLDFTRPMVPRLAPMDLVDSARQVIRLLKDRNETTSVLLELDAPNSEVPCMGDVNLLHVAIENLVRNAIQASPPNGRVRLSVTLADDHPTLVVEDEGPGVADSERERVFEPFFTTRAQGTGLGLPIVRRVAHSHGAVVSLSRSPIGGARFEVVLPPFKRP